MSKLKLFVLGIIVILISQPCIGISGVPDPWESEAFIAFPGPGAITLLVVPDGAGPPFTGAHDSAGNVADGTITIYVRDGSATPIANYPFEDIWLESYDGGMVPCIGGMTADSSTDANGMTRWVNPPFASGWSEQPTLVLINGSPLATNNGLPLKFNSPDINGDGIVNLTDVAILSGEYYAGYAFKCDFNGDGALNLTDIALFSMHYGAECP